MGIVFRQSAKNTLVTLTGAMLGALTLGLSTRYLSMREFGFSDNFRNYAVTIAQLLLLGINYTLVVYIHKLANDDRKRKLLLSLCLAIPAILWLAFSISYLLFKNWALGHFQPEDQLFMHKYFIWLPLYIVLFIYMIVLEQYLGSQYRVAISAFVREIVLRLASIALIVLYGIDLISFDAYIVSSVIVYLIPVSILAFLAMKTPAFGTSAQLKDFSRKEYRELAHFTWYHFLLTISVILLATMDGLLLPLFDQNGFSAAAVYRVAVYLISLLQVPYKAMLTAAFTVLAKAFADNDHLHAANLFRRSSVNILIATMGMALVLYCNLGNVVDVVGEKYREIEPVFLILFLGNIVNIATGMNDQVLSITNFYKFNLYLSLSLIGVLYVLIHTFVPIYGLYGAAWSTAFAMIAFNVIKCLFVWKKLDMLPFSRKTILIILAIVPALLISWLLPHFFTAISNVYFRAAADAVVRSSFVILAYFLMLVWLRPSEDLSTYLASIRKNKRLF